MFFNFLKLLFSSNDIFHPRFLFYKYQTNILPFFALLLRCTKQGLGMLDLSHFRMKSIFFATQGGNLSPLVYLLSSAEGARAAVVGLHAASDKAASRACAWVFMYLLDLNICVLFIERRRRESSGRRTVRS